MQYHSLSSRSSALSVTLHDVLMKSVTYNQNTIVLLFTQLVETLEDLNVQIMLLDFGKATSITDVRKYALNDIEKIQYVKYYPHLAPEVVQGYAPQSKQSDVYALGIIFHQVFDHAEMRDINSKVTKKVYNLAAKCTSPHAFNRPDAKNILVTIKEILCCN